MSTSIPNTKLDKFLLAFVVGIWIALILLTAVTAVKPHWLVQLSMPGKNVEAQTIMGFGDARLHERNYLGAIASYKRALKVEPDLGSAMGNMGIAYHQLGRYDEAIATFMYMLKKVPNQDFTAYYNLAQAYQKTGNTSDAVTFYKLAAETAPYPMSALQQLGQIYLASMQVDLAIDTFARILEMQLNMNTLFISMLKKQLMVDNGDMYNHIEGLILRAEETEYITEYDYSVYRRVQQNNAEVAKTYFFLGNAQVMKGLLDEAEDNFTIALEIKPDFSECRATLSRLRAHMDSKESL